MRRDVPDQQNHLYIDLRLGLEEEGSTDRVVIEWIHKRLTDRYKLNGPDGDNDVFYLMILAMIF
jgi:hypothetical protein